MAGLGGSHANDTLCWTGDTPVPDSGTMRAGALLKTERLPDAGPADRGLNVTVTVTDCPGVKETFDPPTELNPVPVVEALVIVTVELPEFVSCTG